LRKYNLSQKFNSIKQIPTVYKCYLHNLKPYENLLKKIPRDNDEEMDELANSNADSLLKKRKVDELQYLFLTQWLHSKKHAKPIIKVTIIF
jgi:hypothetical protein